jgi:hypothetical protein
MGLVIKYLLGLSKMLCFLDNPNNINIHYKKQTGRVSGPFALFLLFFFFHIDDFSPLVMPAAWANRMRQAHLTTIAALYQVDCLQRISSPAAIASPLR